MILLVDKTKRYIQMQNYNNPSILNEEKIINIKSEVLFREAEDEFYYFYNLSKAQKKLKEAIDLTPNHIKSIMLYANVCYVKGQIKKALNLYKKSEELNNKDSRILASIANCYKSLENYTEALTYTDKALALLKLENNHLYSQLIEIKIDSLVNLKKYKEAYITFIQAQNILDIISLKAIYNSNYELINEKIKLQNRLKRSNLKIV